MTGALGWTGGVNWSFDCVGHPAVLRNALDVLDWGGNALAIGIPPQGTEVSVDVNALAYVDRGLLGCRYGSSRPHHDIPLMVELYLSGQLMLDELVTEQRPLEGFREIVEDMEAGQAGPRASSPSDRRPVLRTGGGARGRPVTVGPDMTVRQIEGELAHGGRRPARRGRGQRRRRGVRRAGHRRPAPPAPDLRRSGTGPPTAWPGCSPRHGVGRGSVVCLMLPELHRLHGLLRRRHPAGGDHLGDQPPPRAAPRSTSILERTRPAVTVVEDGTTAAGRPDRRRARAGRRCTAPPAGRRPTRSPALAPTDPVAVVWTSGTTGLPKGAVFDHDGLAAVAAGTDVLSEPGDRRLSPLPFAHVGSMTRIWDEIANGVTTVITPTPWRAADAIAVMADERITVAQGVPTQWALVLAHPDLGRRRPLVPAHRRHRGLPGAARAGGGHAGAGSASRWWCATPRPRPRSAPAPSPATPTRWWPPRSGRPVPGCRAGRGRRRRRPVADGEVGRVRLRSAAVMRGYWGGPPTGPGAAGVVYDADGHPSRCWPTTAG